MRPIAGRRFSFRVWSDPNLHGARLRIVIIHRHRGPLTGLQLGWRSWADILNFESGFTFLSNSRAHEAQEKCRDDTEPKTCGMKMRSSHTGGAVPRILQVPVTERRVRSA